MVSGENHARSKTTFAPRKAINTALYNPEMYLGGEGLGLNSEQLDISIAYHLLTEVSSP